MLIYYTFNVFQCVYLSYFVFLYIEKTTQHIWLQINIIGYVYYVVSSYSLINWDHNSHTGLKFGCGYIIKLAYIIYKLTDIIGIIHI